MTLYGTETIALLSDADAEKMGAVLVAEPGPVQDADVPAAKSRRVRNAARPVADKRGR